MNSYILYISFALLLFQFGCGEHGLDVAKLPFPTDAISSKSYEIDEIAKSAKLFGDIDENTIFPIAGCDYEQTDVDNLFAQIEQNKQVLLDFAYKNNAQKEYLNKLVYALGVRVNKKNNIKISDFDADKFTKEADETYGLRDDKAKFIEYYFSATKKSLKGHEDDIIVLNLDHLPKKLTNMKDYLQNFNNLILIADSSTSVLSFDSMHKFEPVGMDVCAIAYVINGLIKEKGVSASADEIKDIAYAIRTQKPLESYLPVVEKIAGEYIDKNKNLKNTVITNLQNDFVFYKSLAINDYSPKDIEKKLEENLSFFLPSKSINDLARDLSALNLFVTSLQDEIKNQKNYIDKQDSSLEKKINNIVKDIKNIRISSEKLDDAVKNNKKSLSTQIKEAKKLKKEIDDLNDKLNDLEKTLSAEIVKKIKKKAQEIYDSIKNNLPNYIGKWL